MIHALLIMASTLSTPWSESISDTGIGYGGRASVSISIMFSITSAEQIAFNVDDLGEDIYRVQYAALSVGHSQAQHNERDILVIDNRAIKADNFIEFTSYEGQAYYETPQYVAVFNYPKTLEMLALIIESRGGILNNFRLASVWNK